LSKNFNSYCVYIFKVSVAACTELCRDTFISLCLLFISNFL